MLGTPRPWGYQVSRWDAIAWPPALVAGQRLQPSVSKEVTVSFNQDIAARAKANT